jgi:hypothetical protein
MASDNHLGYSKTESFEEGSPEQAGLLTARTNWADQTETAAQWMPTQLYQAWLIVARDLDNRDAMVPAVAEDDWSDDHEWLVTAMTWWPDGSGAGISVRPYESLADRVAFLADQFQESEVDALWAAGRPPVWPQCPDHPGTHPLGATVRNAVAVWMCSGTDVIAPIGGLI